jgi:hypothetical protein
MTPEQKTLADCIALVEQWDGFLAAVDRKLDDGWTRFLSLGTDIAAAEAQLQKLPPIRTPEQRALDKTMGNESPTESEVAAERLAQLKADEAAERERDSAARAERRNLAEKAATARRERDEAVSAVIAASGVAAPLLADYDAAYERLEAIKAALNLLPAWALPEGWAMPKFYLEDGVTFWDPDQTLAAPVAAWIEQLKSDAAAPPPGGKPLKKAA